MRNCTMLTLTMLLLLWTAVEAATTTTKTTMSTTTPKTVAIKKEVDVELEFMLDNNNTNTNALDDPVMPATFASQSAQTRQYPSPQLPQLPPTYLNGCPLCDASVYSYCTYKVLHDSCCCGAPVGQGRPPQCYYQNCALLYAKSCYEHMLIKNCCCNNPY